MKDQVVCACYYVHVFLGQDEKWEIMEHLRGLWGFDMIFVCLLLCRMNQWDTFPRDVLGSCISICPIQLSPIGLWDSCPGNAVAVCEIGIGSLICSRLALNSCFSVLRLTLLVLRILYSPKLWLVVVVLKDDPPTSAPNHDSTIMAQLFSDPELVSVSSSFCPGQCFCHSCNSVPSNLR